MVVENLITTRRKRWKNYHKEALKAWENAYEHEIH